MPMVQGWQNSVGNPELVTAFDPDRAVFWGFQFEGRVEVDLTTLERLQKQQDVNLFAGHNLSAEGVFRRRSLASRPIASSDLKFDDLMQRLFPRSAIPVLS
jgi:hypothetical protein